MNYYLEVFLVVFSFLLVKCGKVPKKVFFGYVRVDRMRVILQSEKR